MRFPPLSFPPSIRCLSRGRRVGNARQERVPELQGRCLHSSRVPGTGRRPPSPDLALTSPRGTGFQLQFSSFSLVAEPPPPQASPAPITVGCGVRAPGGPCHPPETRGARSRSGCTRGSFGVVSCDTWRTRRGERPGGLWETRVRPRVNHYEFPGTCFSQGPARCPPAPCGARSPASPPGQPWAEPGAGGRLPRGLPHGALATGVTPKPA